MGVPRATSSTVRRYTKCYCAAARYSTGKTSGSRSASSVVSAAMTGATTDAAAAAAAAPASASSGAETAADVVDVAACLRSVYARVAAAATSGPSKDVSIVAVSKTKPVPLLMEAYNAGHRQFGENYVNEIIEKAPVMPADVQWHFIGHLQTNKAKSLVKKVPNLAIIETVDSNKLATFLDRACQEYDAEKIETDEAESGNAEDTGGERTLDVLIQVNTSGEESKHGIEPDEESLLSLAKHITEDCSRLRLRGVMTIGMPDYTSRPENFTSLTKCRTIIAEFMRVEPDELVLSMGMSGDFEAAVSMGSTNVRVGSAIFGKRVYPPR